MELKREHWPQADYIELKKYLISLSDDKYREFNKRIIPDTKLMGVRIPILRKIAKDISKGNYTEFLLLEKGTTHEEVMLDGLVAANIKTDFCTMLSYIKNYSQKIYNWALNDTVSFKNIKNYREQMLAQIPWFVENENPWVIRYGLKILMDFYTDDEYIGKVLEITESVKNEFYYVQMMQGWLLATAFTYSRNCRSSVLEFLKNADISDSVFNMTVRKICDSIKADKSDKELVKKMKATRSS